MLVSDITYPEVGCGPKSSRIFIRKANKTRSETIAHGFYTGTTCYLRIERQ
jgi:hypothetical protein